MFNNVNDYTMELDDTKTLPPPLRAFQLAKKEANFYHSGAQIIPLMLIWNDICHGAGRLCSILYVNSALFLSDGELQ